MEMIKRIRSILANPRGESLMEGIVSILILTVLLASVSMMITISLRLTVASFGDAETLQNQANAAVALAGAVNGTIDMTVAVSPGAVSSVVTVPPSINNVGIIITPPGPSNFIAFGPQP
jgi:hypothetical protein